MLQQVPKRGGKICSFFLSKALAKVEKMCYNTFVTVMTDTDV